MGEEGGSTDRYLGQGQISKRTKSTVSKSEGVLDHTWITLAGCSSLEDNGDALTAYSWQDFSRESADK